ncbi:hypothetical protein J6590_027156 [Homalodisca vitripennis]|nr:hypothetical protein J6590_027156 [Homalodisca vitripennis]
MTRLIRYSCNPVDSRPERLATRPAFREPGVRVARSISVAYLSAATNLWLISSKKSFGTIESADTADLGYDWAEKAADLF